MKTISLTQNYDKSRNNWLSYIDSDYKRIYVGRFKTAEQANIARLNALKLALLKKSEGLPLAPGAKEGE